jgi:DNA-binding Xre family transcriptional regulator
MERKNGKNNLVSSLGLSSVTLNLAQAKVKTKTA